MLKPEFLHSQLLEDAGFHHAFFTRNGGFSVGAYRSLNFSYAVGDAVEHVDANLALAAGQLGVARDRVLFPSQVHGKQVLELTGQEDQLQVVLAEADAVVSGCRDVACGVRTADCVPILLADTATGRVAAVHAGWRGLTAGVIAAAAAQLGGESSRWLAAVGPHISVDAFEVSPEVAERLRSCSDVDPVQARPNAKPHVDLRAITQAQLVALGIPAAQVDHIEGCTHQRGESFFSYRRDGKNSGRHLAAIVPRSDAS